MKIDPGKMDFDKMKSGQNSNGEINANQAKNIDSVNNGARHNPAPSFVPPANPSPVSSSSQPTASLKKPTELLSEAWELYKARWKTLLGIVVAPILFIIPVVIIFGIGIWAFGLIDIFENASFANGLENSPIAFAFFIPLFLIFILAIIITQIWSQVALIYAIKENEDIGIKESYKKGWRKIKQFFWVSMLVGFIIMGGFIFFAIPGFIFAVWFSFATFIVITEDLKGMNAILKSREYVRNYSWSVLWRFLFIYLVLIGVMIVITMITFLLPFLADFISIALTPLLMIYLFLIYNNLRKIKGDFEFRPSAKAKKSFIAVGVLGILAVPISFLLFAFFMSSNLVSVKDKAIDATHHTYLSQIELQLEIYYEERGKYPVSLDEIDKTINIKYIDSETNKPYEYRQLDNGDNYEICVVFKKDGRKCFFAEDSAWDEKETSEDNMKSRDFQRISDLNSISKMLKRYKTENGIYPVSYNSIRLNGNNHITGEIRSTNENKDIPVDPNDPEYYYTYQSSNGKSFEIATRLENMEDKDCEIINNMCIYKITD